MRDGRHRPRLALEPLGRAGIGREVRKEDLDGGVAREALVVGAMDRRHATRSERRDDPVAVREEVAGRGHSA
jgi:hypothetical protein